MNDARGRPIEVGDWVGTGNLRTRDGIPQEGAILGQAIELLDDGTVHLGDGITYEGGEVRALGGYVWYICLECNTPSPIDVRAGAVATCPFCESERIVEDGPVSPHTVADLGL